MPRALRVIVDHRYCVGNAQCLTLAPGVFRHNAQRQSEAIYPAGAVEEVILKAARFCPTSAIRVEDADTGQTLFPTP